MTPQEWLDAYDKDAIHPRTIYDERASTIIRDLLAEVERLRGHIKTFQKIFPARLNEARRMGQVDANKSWEEGHIYGKEQERLRKEDNAVFTEEIMKLEERLQAAQIFAAYLQEVIADKELLVGQERKRVAEECIDYVNNHANDCGCSKRIAHDIRTRYGVD